ncbi:MAG: Lrp/AsnC family transcriptional regulator [Betaproteobacteria bacterium]|nr:Lrp/AsnC family transcriptional regulator [Betaproteobacteria bacterium]MDE2047452.1 Lrp/AsnC family transcriptional regulator [Betaproteobacteria bacterium]
MNDITLDRIDRKILNLLQADNQLPTKLLAQKVNVSAPTALRRVRTLREAGIIESDVAMLNPLALGLGLMVFVEVSLASQSDEQLRAFEQRMMSEPEVLQCYFVTGQYDYFLIVHVADMEAYYQFVRRVLSGTGGVRHFESKFPMRRVKFSTALAMDEKQPELTLKLPPRPARRARRT